MNNWLEIKSQIKAFCSQNNDEQLKIYLESLLDVDSSNPLLLAYGGVSYMLVGEGEKAIALWLDCFLLADDQELENIAESLAELADLHLKNHQYYQASLIYQQVLEFNAFHCQSYLNLGYCLLFSGNFDDAMEVWKNGLAINSSWAELSLNIAKEYQYIREYHQAINYYLEALNFYPNNSHIYYNLGLCYGGINEVDTAIDYHHKCLKLNPNLLSVYGELGYLYLLKGEIKKVKEYWQVLLNLNFNIFASYLNWSDGDNSKNISLNRQLISSLLEDNNLLELEVNIANLLFEQKQYSLAIKYYQLVIDFLLLKTEAKSSINKANVNLYKTFKNIIICLKDRNLDDDIEIYLNILSSLDPINAKKIIKKLKPIWTVNNLQKTGFEKNSVNNYYETAQEWVVKINQIENYQLIYDNNKLKLNRPESIDNKIHPSFYFPPDFPLPSSFVTTVKKGRFWLRQDEGSSAIITHDNYLLGDISPESPALSPNHPDKHPSYHSLLKSSSLPPVTMIKGRVVVLAGLLNNIYFHWLFDILPRIHLLEKASIDWDDIDSVVVDNRCQFQRETLDIFGIPASKIVPLSFPTHIEADELIVPSFPSAIAWMPPWSCQYLRTKIIGDNLNKETPHKKIYISRAKSSNRRLINELEIITILQQYNFEIVNLELLSVRQQAELLNQAKIVISPHGSGLSNLVFCQPNTKVIEICSPNYVYPCYWLVSNILELEYHYILGEIFGSKSVDNFLYPDSRFEDIYINPDNLKVFLNGI
ncbi:TPR repeat domain protein [Cyanobacterium sp. HL-69]|uniref:glycosyltransferase 61 family protein n=1 Tax=Cyanobacterium sp. HL-69 TaxID=2054282 RepID=UPI000CA1D350|nr:TPR repeat domain protein [Cyanobacterium sp. HL-69]